MKNLENYGVLEMDAKEIRGIDGGFLGIGTLAVILAVTYLVGTVAGIAQGYPPSGTQ